ncbi:hypothetical protein HD554DRAFT_1079571 [Boletus coccyginus]|nr:hypothetical protein HD554DRAFT_1079571 [Boletus coccyginus]
MLSTPINPVPLFAGYIVNMMRLDYFDEAIGVTEGFSILEDLLRCSEIKRQILGYDIAAVLESKLGAGIPGEMRTGLIYLNLFRIHGEDSLTQNLVERGMSHLRTNQWRTQKAGVAILCSLAQTWFGVEALKQVIPEVVNMILPVHDSSHQQAASQPRTLSSLLGPAFVVRVLANNETLREEIRQTAEYRRLKHLFLFGDLLGTKETPIWQVRTPTRDDVLGVISQMIKSVDSVEGSTNAGFILPDIRHWDRIARVLRNGVVWAMVIPSVVVGVAALTVVGAIALAPVYVSRKVIEWVGRSWRLRQQNAIITSLKLPDCESPVEVPSSSVLLDADTTCNDGRVDTASGEISDGRV